MVSDRALADVFRLRPRTIALWGDAIRAVCIAAIALLMAAMTLIYADTVGNTIAIRHLQDFAAFYRSAASEPVADNRNGEAGLADRRAPPPDLNPPHFRLFVHPFTYLEPATAFLVWMAVSALAYIVSIAVICRSLSLGVWGTLIVCALTYLSPAMFATLLSGQLAPLLLLPMTLAWRAARRGNDGVAGAWIGVCASLKAPLLLHVPAFAMTRRLAAAAALSGVTTALFAAGLARSGLEAHREWIRNLATVTWTEHYMNASVLGLVQRSLSISEWPQRPLADAPALVWPIWIIAAGIICVSTFLRLRRSTTTDDQVLLVTAAALLVSPIAWVYYFWLLVPSLTSVVVRSAGTCSRRRKALLTAALAGLLVPPVLPWMAVRWSGLATVSVGSVYCWSLAARWLFTVSGPAGPAEQNPASAVATSQPVRARPERAS